MKTKILNMIERNMSNAMDNLYRAETAFRNVQDKNAIYGNSGQTYQEIIDGYQKIVDEFSDMKQWIIKNCGD